MPNLMEGGLKIKEFYFNKTIMITGCTGFIGKVILEKLLRVCKPKKLFIMVRPKRNVAPMDRVNEILKSECFNVIKEKLGNDGFL